MRIREPVPMTRDDIINSMGFRDPHIRDATVKALDKHRFIDIAVHLQLALPHTPKGITYIAKNGRRMLRKYAAEGLRVLMSVMLDPQLGLTQSQLNSAMAPIRSYGDNQFVMKQYGVFMWLFINHHLTKFGTMPDLDALTFVGSHAARVSGLSYINALYNSKTSKSLEVPSCRYQDSAVLVVVETVDDSSLVAPVMSLSESSSYRDLIKELYWSVTGTSWDWLTDAIVDEIVSDKDPLMRLPKIRIEDIDIDELFSRIADLTEPHQSVL